MIIDAFPFFQETDLLKVRLEYLGKYVDKFIISESDVDFSGRPKELVLCNRQLKNLPYNEKIEIVQSRSTFIERKLIYPISKKLRWRYPLWKIQAKQRNAIYKAIKNVDARGIFLFGDLDEFPDPEKFLLHVRKTKNSECLHSLEQSSRVYNLKTQDGDGLWRGTMVCSINTAKKTPPNEIRKMRFSSNPISCGWHFSYFGSKKQIIRKIESISAVEKHFHLNAKSNKIENRICSNINPFSNSTSLPVKIELKDYPTDLIECFRKHMPCAL